MNADRLRRWVLGRGKGAAVWVLVRLLASVSRRAIMSLAALLLFQALLGAVFVLAAGTVVGSLPPAAQDGVDSPAGHRLMLAFGVFTAIFLLDMFLQPCVGLLAFHLGWRVSETTALAVLRGTLAPIGIAHLENPATADRIRLAQGVDGGAFSPSQAVTALTSVAAARLAGLTSVVLLLGFHWWAPVPLAVAWISTGVWRGREIQRAVQAQANDTVFLRKADYLRDLALDGSGAKEIRVFGLRGWLVERFTRDWLEGMRQLGRCSGGPWKNLASLVLLAGAHAAVLVPLSIEAAHGMIGLDEFTVSLQAVLGMATLGWIGDIQWIVTGASAAVPHALAVGELPARDPMCAGKRPVNGLPSLGIHFEDVSFAYPHGDRPVIDHLDLSIPAETSLAIVGDNGAGKTTLIKLLARLYDPDRGQVTVDGIDLRELDTQEWRRRLAVVFQDFVRYELPARDNIGFGHVDAPRTDDALANAAALGGIADVVAGLSAGWDTLLSRQYTGGAELSGGQWQRLALARALFAVEHGARVLVLDEPTAHLDVRAECELYERFLELTRGLTTILISHRFATVRLADVICVLDGGRVTEYGTHQGLLARGGRYARMFDMQAAPFRGGTRG